MNYQTLSQKILDLIGTQQNITSFTNCMTRLRLNLKDPSLANAYEIKKLDGVLGVVSGQEFQIIVGPGHAQRLCQSLEQVTKMSATAPVESDYSDLASTTKAQIKSKQKTSLHTALSHVGNIFLPLIPGFIACGLITAIANLCKAFNPDIVSHPWFLIFAALGSLIFAFLHIITGYNAGKEFGGSAILGAIAGAMIYLPQLNTATIPILGITLKAGYGGIIGVIIAAAIFAAIEKRVRRIIPAAFDLFLVPLITIAIGAAVTFIIIMPISALLMEGITFILVDFALKSGGIVGGYILAATFLPLVMLGIHQGLLPIHAQLIADSGYTVLLPILAQAGAGQVGMAIAVYIKTKDQKLKKIITSALPIGFLGIGEPLIYGVSLPLFYPFITACLGAGFGGALIAFVTSHIADVGAGAFGLSGLLMIPLIANNMWIWYLLGIFASYIGGFVLTFLFGYKEKYLQRLK